mmetsp:Transcript_37761/g.42272  ORF Transcript_37761/g.42272 Transcript_37761/m.42272 type:complete len:223 (+) Transcript_37761:659-1327(+)
MINNTTNTNTDTKSSTETNNLSRHESAHEKKMRRQRESRKIKKEEREKQPGYVKPKTGRPSNADRMSSKELEHNHQKRKKQQHNMISDHRKKGNEAIQVVESDVKETRIDTAQTLLSLNTSFQSSRTTDVQNLADAAKVLANTTPGAVRSVLGNSLDNVTADYATALNNSVLTVRSSMKESMRRIHEIAPTLTSTVKTQRNIAGFDHDDNGNSDGDIDDMIT